jgi:hypothetical protein
VQIEYEISEQDFMDAQRLAIRNSTMRLVRWTRWGLPLFGVALLIFLINVVVTQGFRGLIPRGQGGGSILPSLYTNPSTGSLHFLSVCTSIEQPGNILQIMNKVPAL